MPFAIKSERYGTILGIIPTRIFLTGTDREMGDTAGLADAITFDTPEDAEEAIKMLINMTKGAEEGTFTLSQGDLSFAQVASGHWKDLEAAGLEIGDMADNEPRHIPVTGMP